MKTKVRELESRIARLEKQSSKNAMKILHRQLIKYLKKNKLKNMGKTYSIEYGGTWRDIKFEFALILDDNEYEEMTKFFNKEKRNYNDVIINDDALDSVIKYHLGEDEYFAPSSARYAGGSPFCILSLHKNGMFILSIDMTIEKKKTPKAGLTPLGGIDLGLRKKVFDIKRLSFDLWIFLKDQIAFKLESIGREEEVEDLADRYRMEVSLLIQPRGSYLLRVKSGRDYFTLKMEDTEKHEITNSRGRYSQKALLEHLDLNYDDYTRWEVK